jgi:hypothetical protein
MVKYLFYLCLLGLSCLTACVQTSADSNECYSETPTNSGDVFTGMVQKPHFKGGHDSLVSFLQTHIDLENFAGKFSQNKMAYTDTASLKFIVNKGGGISALSITKAKNKIFIDEVTRAMKKSSCSWVAGGSEQLVNGWHQFEIFVSIERPHEKELSTSMTIYEL